jgi:hypothetical protein
MRQYFFRWRPLTGVCVLASGGGGCGAAIDHVVGEQHRAPLGFGCALGELHSLNDRMETRLE